MKISIFGVEFDNVTKAEAVEKAIEALDSRRFQYVVTPNPEIVNLARTDVDYRSILNEAALVLPDGIGIVKAGRILGEEFKGRVPGIEFAEALMKELARRGDKLFLFGAEPGVAARAARRLGRRYPGLNICGSTDGFFVDDAIPFESIKEAKPDVVFVCLGAPKQERWIHRFGPQTGATLMVGLGGAFDVFSGKVKRAPDAWKKANAEWLYRLLREPKRIGRVAKLPFFLLDVNREANKTKERVRPTKAEAPTQEPHGLAAAEENITPTVSLPQESLSQESLPQEIVQQSSEENGALRDEAVPAPQEPSDAPVQDEFADKVVPLRFETEPEWSFDMMPPSRMEEEPASDKVVRLRFEKEEAPLPDALSDNTAEETGAPEVGDRD